MRETTREQQRAAEIMAEVYGRSAVSPSPLNYATGTVVLTGLTDDIERDKVMITTDGEVASCLTRESEFVKRYVEQFPEYQHGKFRPMVHQELNTIHQEMN